MSDLRLAAMQLAAELGKVELLVVTEENRQLVTEQLAGWNESDPGISQERLERLLFVSPVPISLCFKTWLCSHASIRSLFCKISSV